MGGPKVWCDTHYGDARKTPKVRRDLYYPSMTMCDPKDSAIYTMAMCDPKVRRDLYYGDVRP